MSNLSNYRPFYLKRKKCPEENVVDSLKKKGQESGDIPIEEVKKLYKKLKPTVGKTIVLEGAPSTLFHLRKDEEDEADDDKFYGQFDEKGNYMMHDASVGTHDLKKVSNDLTQGELLRHVVFKKMGTEGLTFVKEACQQKEKMDGFVGRFTMSYGVQVELEPVKVTIEYRVKKVEPVQGFLNGAM